MSNRQQMVYPSAILCSLVLRAVLKSESVQYLYLYALEFSPSGIPRNPARLYVRTSTVDVVLRLQYSSHSNTVLLALSHAALYCP
jgi:hypothetical protein